jgi:mannose/fructose-specific phosphotransferase system component IIA
LIETLRKRLFFWPIGKVIALFITPREDRDLPLVKILDKYQREIAEVILADLIGGSLLRVLKL